MSLTTKHQIFVDEYLKCYNATQAYLLAYPRVTRATAGANGHELLKNTEIKEAISQRLSESAMSADEVLMRLAEQARGEHSKYISDEGYVKIGDIVKDGKAHLIKEIEEAKDGTKKYKFYDAQSALNTLAKHHGLLTDKMESTINNFDIDYSKLTTEQLQRISKGENVLKVIIDGYISSRTGES